MGSHTEMKELNSEFHRAEQQAPLTVQPRKQGAGAGTEEAPAQHTLGYKSAEVTCPKCNRQVNTVLTYRITDFTHLTVFLCSLATWPCGMCFLSGIPYYLSVCQKVDHQCPHCKTLIGKHAKFKLSEICCCIKNKK